MSHVVNAAIAYCDALTAKYGGYVNQKDHGAAIKTLRDVSGNRFPIAQETRLFRILGVKDEVQYGARLSTTGEAERLLKTLLEFGEWVELEFTR